MPPICLSLSLSLFLSLSLSLSLSLFIYIYIYIPFKAILDTSVFHSLLTNSKQRATPLSRSCSTLRLLIVYSLPKTSVENTMLNNSAWVHNNKI